MINGRHLLYVTDEKTGVFQSQAGRSLFRDVPVVDRIDSPGTVDWLWPDRIPLERVTLIEGPPGAGKSFVALDLAARVSNGQAWPGACGEKGERREEKVELVGKGGVGKDRVEKDGAPVSTSPAAPAAVSAGRTARPPGNCLLVCRQDNFIDTVGSRLDAAGSDPDRLVRFSQFTSIDSFLHSEVRPARFPGDLPAIEYLLDQDKDIRLIVIDPLSDFCPLPGLVAETLERLNDLAAEYGIAIVVTLRATGRFDSRGRLHVKSRWATDAARCAWFVTADPQDDARRLFVPTRTNFCVEPAGLEFRIEDGRVAWNADTPIAAKDPLKCLSGAALWLSQILAEGDMKANDLYSLGSEFGYTCDMLKYAGDKIGVCKRRIGGKKGAYWEWSLQAETLNE